MPGKNTIKTYVEKGFYHVYNRGVNKQPIFLDERDYRIFLFYMDLYLLSKEESAERIKRNSNLTEDEKNKKFAKLMYLNNFHDKIEILCYALMPNHFHFILRQINKIDMELFVKSLLTKYAQYFNKKYDRVGPVFQGRYKAILINKEEYLLHLSRYIHLNPKEILQNNQKLFDYLWSSYFSYINDSGQKWLNKNYILSYFMQSKGFDFSSYQGFVEGYKEKSEEESLFFNKLILD